MDRIDRIASMIGNSAIAVVVILLAIAIILNLLGIPSHE